jgi:hypothetical protein
MRRNPFDRSPNPGGKRAGRWGPERQTTEDLDYARAIVAEPTRHRGFLLDWAKGVLAKHQSATDGDIRKEE